MQVFSNCPLRVRSIVWQPAPGSWALTVICKATFTLAPGNSPLAAIQEDPQSGDRGWDGHEASSLYAPSDLVPFKARADVILVGHAFSPGQTPTNVLATRLSFGDIDKSVEVFADRVWGPDGQMRMVRPFATMPLRYERAAGGPGTWNPVGIPFDAPPDAQGVATLPNLQPPGLSLTRRGEPIAPIGFGPIAPGWPARVEKLGRHVGAWSPTSWEAHPVPAALDPGYFNAAPPDQQLDSLRPGERILLKNLNPGCPVLVTRLAPVAPLALLDRGRGLEPIALSCDTLWIDTDRAVAALIFRGRLALSQENEPGEIRISLEKAALAPSLGRPDRRSPKDEATSPILARRPPPEAPEDPSLPPPSSTTTTDTKLLQNWSEDAVRHDALPFVRAPSANAPPVLREHPHVEPLFNPPASRLTVGQMTTLSTTATPPPPRPVEEDPPRLALPAPTVKESASRSLVELLWFGLGALPRIRKQTAWSELLAEVEPRPDDDDLEDELGPGRRSSGRDRRAVLAVLTHGEAIDPGAVARAMATSVGDDGTFTPPLLLVSGELEHSFDELETLKATIAAVTPFLAGDDKLRATVDAVHELFKTPWMQGSPSMLEGLTAQIQETFAKSQRSQERWLSTHVDRTLLAHRQYRKRVVLGQPRIRCSLSVIGGKEAVPAYLPESLSRELPAFRRFRARLIAEARPQLEEEETHPCSLRVVALARVVSLTADRGSKHEI